GWHPCLTLDRPILPPERVPSLVGREGAFHSLGGFLRQLCLGRLSALEMEAELEAQCRRFQDLVGSPPPFVNAHHHVHVFPPVADALLTILGRQKPLPYLRRIREPWPMLWQVPGARLKRAILSRFGQRLAARPEHAGFPGNHWLVGITDPAYVEDPIYLVRWLTRIPGQVVELACHPGYHDESLLGRDCTPEDGMLRRR